MKRILAAVTAAAVLALVPTAPADARPSKDGKWKVCTKNLQPKHCQWLVENPYWSGPKYSRVAK